MEADAHTRPRFYALPRKKSENADRGGRAPAKPGFPAKGENT